MTKLFLAGAENQQHQALLVSCSVDKVAVNVGALMRRAAFSTWTLDLPYPDWEWIAYTDGPVTSNDLELAIDKAAKPPLYVVGSTLWEDHPDYLPLYNGVGAVEADVTRGLFITDGVFQNDDSKRRILSLNRPGMELGVITGSTDRGISRFNYVISSAWYSTMTYGETQVWDGQKMSRYNSKRKLDARKKHEGHMVELGVDPTLIASGDTDENARLAIFSWQQYGDNLISSMVPVTNQANGNIAQSGSGPLTVAGTTPVARQQVIMPGVAQDTIWADHTDKEGITSQEEMPLVRSSSGMIRSCNNCHLATAGCPGYQPGAQCAYELPVQIRNRDQIKAVMESFIEIQAQRVFQARFSEEIQGQELSPATGREIDRLFKITEKMTDILDDSDSLKLSIKSKAQSGVISRLFGQQPGERARQLANPIDTNDVLDAIEVK
jgi:hypothetical protein